MKPETFFKGLKSLCQYYEKTSPVRETRDMWFDKVRTLPDEAMPWIVQQITDQMEFFPRNLPGAILKLWPQWLWYHPEKRSTFYDGCPDCDQDGWLHVRDKEGLVYAFRCGCGRLQNSAPSARFHELTARGYREDTLDEAARWRVPSKGKSSNINWTEYVEMIND